MCCPVPPEAQVMPTLFINKLDRLALELRMTPAEVYTRVQQIVQHANMIWSGFRSEQFLSEADAVLAYEGAAVAAAAADATAEPSEPPLPEGLTLSVMLWQLT